MLISAGFTYNLGVAAASNAVPVVSGQSISTNEDTDASITLSGSDGDDDPLSYLIVSGPTNGTLIGTAPNLTYRPNANFNGSDSFTFLADDGIAISNTATVSITINAINDAPVASNSSFNIDIGSFGAGTVTASDAEGATLTYSLVQGASNGSLVFFSSSGEFIYTHKTGFTGADSFRFRANDGTSDSNTATVTFNVGEFSNDAPVANGQIISTDEDTAKSITLTATDEENNVLTFSIVTQPTNGTLSRTSEGVYLYTPNLNFNGADSFTFRANDGTANSNTATVSITVNQVFDVPVANPQSVSTSEDTAVNITLSGSDPETAQLNFTVKTQPTNGTLLGTAPNLIYTPNAGFNGSDSFTFTVFDPDFESLPATVSISVSAVNDAPVASDQSVSTSEDVAVSITLGATDSDGDTLSYSIVSQPTNGVLSGSGANRIYTPNANFNGSDSFTFRANDGSADSNTATVSISVSAVNDAPVASAQSVSTDQNTALSITLSGSDAENSALTFSVLTQPTNGTLSGTAPNLTYTPNANFFGADSFTFRVSDGSLNSNTATVSITVNQTNQAPTTSDVSVSTTRDVPVEGAVEGEDADGDTLAFTLGNAPQNGTASVQSNGAFRYTPNSGFVGSDSFTVSVSDGQESATATVSVVVSSSTSAPVVIVPSRLPSFRSATNQFATLVAEVRDLDGALDVRRIEISGKPISLPSNGSRLENERYLTPKIRFEIGAGQTLSQGRFVVSSYDRALRRYVDLPARSGVVSAGNFVYDLSQSRVSVVDADSQLLRVEIAVASASANTWHLFAKASDASNRTSSETRFGVWSVSVDTSLRRF